MQNMAVPYFGNYGHYSSGDIRLCKIKRLIAESAEVAVTLCHRYLGALGNVKLFDIVNQIIPTAWVLNTGYWVYYSNQQGHSLCVCSRFAIPCRHVRNYDHWVDLSSTTDHLPDVTTAVLPPNATVTAGNFECDVMPMGYEVYNITAKFELQIRGAGGSEIRLIERKFLWFEGSYTISLERYVTSEAFIMFHPNPQSMPWYGKILTDTLINNGVEDTFVTSNTSKYTFLLSPVNTQFSYTTIAFPMYCTVSHMETQRERRPRMNDVFTQTDESEEQVSSSESLQRYTYASSYSQYSVQTPSFYNQLPPPYPYQKQVKTEALYSERKLKRSARSGGNSSSGGYSNLTLAMYLNNNVGLNQQQSSKGRKQKKGTRRIKTEPTDQCTTSGQGESSSFNNDEFDLINEIIAEDLRENKE